MSTNDKQFMDQFMLIIGILVGVAVALAVLASIIASRTQLQALHEDPAYQQQVNDRLKPAGTVILAGQGSPEEQATVAVTSAPVAAPLSGPQVFNQACTACHGAGINGAPKFGDKAAWTPRLAQGIATLKKHALEGFQGQKGVMPAKGGFVNFSDAEVTAAVDYMASQAK